MRSVAGIPIVEIAKEPFSRADRARLDSPWAS
jgi:hypothetical protein